MRRRSCAPFAICLLGASLALPVGAEAQPSSDGWTLTVADTLRIESWRFFDPPPAGGDPDYAFAGNRLLVQARWSGPRLDVTLAAQHVGLLGLPDDATGPGALGTGALYFAQGNQGSRPQQLYLRFANLRVRNLAPGLDVQVGRQGYSSGLEATGGNSRVEFVKRQRLSARLVGESLRGSPSKT